MIWFAILRCGAGVVENLFAASSQRNQNETFVCRHASFVRDEQLFEGGDLGDLAVVDGVHEAAARHGEERLARLAVTKEDAKAVVVPPPIHDVIEPDRALHEAYQPRLQAFRALYKALAPVWPSVAG